MNETTPARRPSGAAARRERDQRVRRLSRRARRLLPWVEEADGPAIRTWAELEVLATLAYQNLCEGGILNDAGEPRALLESYQRLRKTQLAFERELGMTPSARMALKANGTRAAMDIAAQLARVGADEVEVVADGKPSTDALAD